MAYRFEQLTNTPSGAGLAKNTWHKLTLTPTTIGPVLDIAGYIDWVQPPALNLQVAGYGALFWTDNGRYGGVPIVGATRAIVTRFLPSQQGLHLFASDDVDPYRDANGFLPSGAGILFFIEDWLPDFSWRFFGAVP